jgi:hypothetical protein
VPYLAEQRAGISTKLPFVLKLPACIHDTCRVTQVVCTGLNATPVATTKIDVLYSSGRASEIRSEMICIIPSWRPKGAVTFQTISG